MNTGFRQQYEALDISTGSYSVHFSFDVSGQNPITNYSNYPSISGTISSISGFYTVPGSGFFTGQTVRAIGVQTGDYWSHIFINQKTGSAGGVLFDSFQSGSNGIYSGYLIGFNDNNKLFCEFFDNAGPAVYTSDITLAKKNCLAVTRANNALNFYAYDFNNELLLTDTKVINGQFLLPSTKFLIGGISGAPSYINYSNYKGYLDEYAYINDAIIPSHLQSLMSGFVAYSSYVQGIITSVTGVEVTGFGLVFTGTTGNLGYQNTAISSGLDDFGDYYVTYGQTAITGYLTSGSGIVPLTGLVIDSYTGESGFSYLVNTGYIESFRYDEVSYLRKIDSNDFNTLFRFTNNKKGINKVADFDLISNNFELDSVYVDSGIQIYLNGVQQSNQGFTVTGNIYNQGVVISGSYYLDDFAVQSTGFYEATDLMLYDVISGQKQRAFITGMGVSGRAEAVTLNTGSIVFLNGILINSGTNYLNNGGIFRWNSNIYSGITGALSVFQLDQPYTKLTGILGLTGDYPLGASMLYLNGQRQRVEIDYVQNSTIDLISQSGLYNLSVNSIYDSDDTYWE